MRKRLVIALVAGAVLSASVSAPRAGAGSTDTARSVGLGIGFVDDGVCGVLADLSLGKVANRLLGVAARKGLRLRGSWMLASFTIASATSFCPEKVKAARHAVTGLFGSDVAPSAPPSLPDLTRLLTPAEATALASDLRTAGAGAYFDGASALRLVRLMCGDVVAGVDPGVRLAQTAPSASLSSIGIVAKAQSLAIKSCAPALTPAQASVLGDALFRRLLTAQPPGVIPTEVRGFASLNSDGTRTVFPYWMRTGSTETVDVWVQVSGSPWARVPPRTPLTVDGGAQVSVYVSLLPGTVYRFALQGKDGSGNRGAFAYTAWHRILP